MVVVVTVMDEKGYKMAGLNAARLVKGKRRHGRMEGRVGGCGAVSRNETVVVTLMR